MRQRRVPKLLQHRVSQAERSMTPPGQRHASRPVPHYATATGRAAPPLGRALGGPAARPASARGKLPTLRPGSRPPSARKARSPHGPGSQPKQQKNPKTQGWRLVVRAATASRGACSGRLSAPVPLPGRRQRAARLAVCGVHRIYDFGAFCLPWSAPCFRLCCRCYRSCLPLISLLGSCILILLCCPSDQCTSERARSIKIIRR
jgi:hypothetical protein